GVPTQIWLESRPRGAKLELMSLGWSGDVAVADRGGARHRPAQRRVRARLLAGGLRQPAPRHLGQERVARERRLHVRLNVGHQSQRAVPGVVARRVVQEDQPAERVAVGELRHILARRGVDLYAESVTVRGEPLWRPDRTDGD